MPSSKQGIIVGSNQSQEWLLPWWWENYKKHNQYPVAFFDFGLTSDMKKWCREKGPLIQLPQSDVFIKDKEEIPPSTALDWESRHGETFWNYRKTWFKKPLACLQSPFEKTIWIDLDCQIQSSLEPLFQIDSSLALSRDMDAPCPYYPVYNSGVIVFHKNNPLLKEWATLAFEQNDLYMGDQDLLSKIIFEKKYPIIELEPLYNWSIFHGLNPEATIIHWICDLGKNLLRDRIILSQL